MVSLEYSTSDCCKTGNNWADKKIGGQSSRLKMFTCTISFVSYFLLLLVIGLFHPFDVEVIAQQHRPMSSARYEKLFLATKSWVVLLITWTWVKKNSYKLWQVYRFDKSSKKCVFLDVLLLLIAIVGTQFTFFAPTNWAFVRVMPMDVADPFFVDSKLRQDVFLHHFVQRSMTKDDLLNNSELVMADQKPSSLTHSGPNGTFSSSLIVIWYSLDGKITIMFFIFVSCLPLESDSQPHHLSIDE